MKLTDLDFTYPEDLVATEPQRPSRVMWVEGLSLPREVGFRDLLNQIPPQAALVVNNTKVLKRRVFAGDLEILFLKQINATDWEVLFPSKKFKIGDKVSLPQGLEMTLLVKGRPQVVRLSQEVEESYFAEVAELPLPPYIQKARSQRHTVDADESWYQTAWAQKAGSFAAPTASLHFSKEDIDYIKSRGVKVYELTLHVGLGTFLPVTVDDLDDHEMHEEMAEISAETWSALMKHKERGDEIWALGTTSVRSLESAALGLLQKSPEGGFIGATKLLIQPGYQWQMVDVLMTNFHQPQSTLLALVAAFTNIDHVKTCYSWAIENKFRLFSYGDLSIWRKNASR